MITIRKATAKDSQWVAQQWMQTPLFHSKWAGSCTSDSLAGFALSPDYLFLIAIDSQKPCGFTIVNLTDDKHAFLTALWGERQEVVDGLLRGALMDLKARGAEAVTGLVNEKLAVTCSALAAQGFREVQRLQWVEMELPPVAHKLLPPPNPPQGVSLHKYGVSYHDGVSALLEGYNSRIEGGGLDYRYSSLDFALSSKESVVFVALEGERVIGAILGRLIGQAAYVDAFLVDQKDRARGIGTALILAFIHHVAPLGALVILGYVNSKDDALLRQYGLHGARKGAMFVKYELDLR